MLSRLTPMCIKSISFLFSHLQFHHKSHHCLSFSTSYLSHRVLASHSPSKNARIFDYKISKPSSNAKRNPRPCASEAKIHLWNFHQQSEWREKISPQYFLVKVLIAFISTGIIMSNREDRSHTGICCWLSWSGCRPISRWSDESRWTMLEFMRLSVNAGGSLIEDRQCKRGEFFNWN